MRDFEKYFDYDFVIYINKKFIFDWYKVWYKQFYNFDKNIYFIFVNILIIKINLENYNFSVIFSIIIFAFFIF